MMSNFNPVQEPSLPEPTIVPTMNKEGLTNSEERIKESNASSAVKSVGDKPINFSSSSQSQAPFSSSSQSQAPFSSSSQSQAPVQFSMPVPQQENSGPSNEMTVHSSIHSDDLHGNYLRSSNRAYFAILHPSGDFSVYQSCHIHPKNKIWSTSTKNKGTAPYSLRLLEDGNLILFDAVDKTIWKSDSYAAKAVRLEMSDDGNLSLRNAQDVIVWQTHNERAKDQDEMFLSPLIGAPSEMTNGLFPQKEYLKSPNGAYYLRFGRDGLLSLFVSNHLHSKNLIWRMSLRRHIFSSVQTQGAGPFRLILEQDGNLQAQDSTNAVYWHSGTSEKGVGPHRLCVRDDGNLVLIDGDGKLIWQSHTARKSSKNLPAPFDRQNGFSSA